MGFNDLIAKCNHTMMTRFGNADIIMLQGAVAVKTFRGVFDEFGEVVSPFESERLVTKPTLSAETSVLDGVTSVHVFDVTRDDTGSTKQYKLDGKPVHDGAGLTVIHLSEKK